MTEPTDQLPRRPRPVRRRTRHLRRVGAGAVVALLAVTVGALVTNSPLDAATSGTGVTVEATGPTDTLTLGAADRRRRCRPPVRSDRSTVGWGRAASTATYLGTA